MNIKRMIKDVVPHYDADHVEVWLRWLLDNDFSQITTADLPREIRVAANCVDVAGPTVTAELSRVYGLHCASSVGGPVDLTPAERQRLDELIAEAHATERARWFREEERYG